MDILGQYKNKILEIDKFVKELDPAVRAEAFRFLISAVLASEGARAPEKTSLPLKEERGDDSRRILERLSQESSIPVERLTEVYAVKDSTVYVIDSSIPSEGPAGLLKKITLLCAYGNSLGRGIAKVEVSTIYKNLKELKAVTTAYSRDVKGAEGVKVLADKTIMLAPDGREKAQELLKKILKLGS